MKVGTVGGEDEIKRIFLRPENKYTMKYGGLAVFIRHDYAEIWRFKRGLTLVIGTRKIMASTGVFVRVVYALKHSMKNFPS
jgi:mevalonate kinase